MSSDFRYWLDTDTWSNDYVTVYGEDMPEELMSDGE